MTSFPSATFLCTLHSSLNITLTNNRLRFPLKVCFDCVTILTSEVFSTFAAIFSCCSFIIRRFCHEAQSVYILKRVKNELLVGDLPAKNALFSCRINSNYFIPHMAVIRADVSRRFFSQLVHLFAGKASLTLLKELPLGQYTMEI